MAKQSFKQLNALMRKTSLATISSGGKNDTPVTEEWANEEIQPLIQYLDENLEVR